MTTTQTTTQTEPAAPATPAAPQAPVEQVLSDKLQDTTDSNDSEMFGEGHVTSFDRDEGDVVETAPVVAPVEVTRPEVPAAATVPSAAPVAPAEITLPIPLPPATPVAAVPAPAPQPVMPQAPTVPAQQPQVVAPQAPASVEAPAAPVDMAATVRALQEQRSQVEAALSQHYGLSQEEADAFATDPAGALPKMAAKVHINAVAAALTHVAQHLPQLVNGMLEVRQRSAEAERTFYERWPQLDRTKHDHTVRQMAQVYRQMNPNATTDDFVRHVGAQAVVALGLLQPSVNAVQAPAVPARQAPFVPAAVSAPVARAGGQNNKNLFELYNELLLGEDG